METTQINLRLSPELLQQLDQRCEELGISRTNALRLAAQMWLSGAPGAQPVTPAPVPAAAVDEGARQGLLKLKARVEAVEQELKEMRSAKVAADSLQVAADKLLAETSDSFADQFSA